MSVAAGNMKMVIGGSEGGRGRLRTTPKEVSGGRGAENGFAEHRSTTDWNA